LESTLLSFEPVGSGGLDNKNVKKVRTLFHESLLGDRILREQAYSFDLQAILFVSVPTDTRLIGDLSATMMKVKCGLNSLQKSSIAVSTPRR